MIRMPLEKRDCGVNVRLVPHGAGWTYVYLDINGDHLYFVISSAVGNQFDDLLRALYHLHPDNNDYEKADDLIDIKFGICEKTADGYKVAEIADDWEGHEFPFVVQYIPWTARFTWDEEGSCSNWVLERKPTKNTDFMLKIQIDICRDTTESYCYEIRYADFCYAVAKACTESLKTHGFFGYHHATFTQDMNVRYLLFLKSIALGNFEAWELTYYREKEHGETCSFQKEIELLLFDM